MNALTTFPDNSQISKLTFKTIFNSLQSLNRENSVALWDLTEKCRDASYKILLNPRGDTVEALKKWGLMTKEDQISPDVKCVVLKCVKGSNFFEMALKNPTERHVTFLIPQ